MGGSPEGPNNPRGHKGLAVPDLQGRVGRGPGWTASIGLREARGREGETKVGGRKEYQKKEGVTNRETERQERQGRGGQRGRREIPGEQRERWREIVVH